MIRSGRWLSAVAVGVVAAVLAACGGDGSDEIGRPLPTTTTESIVLGEDADPTTTTSTTPPTVPPLGPDPFAVPGDADAITAEYVEAVLNELARLNGDALRIAIRDGLLSMEALALLESVFVDDELQIQVNILVDAANEGFPGILPSPGDRTFEVDEITVARTDCIGVVVTADFSAIAVDPPPLAQSTVELRRAETRLDDLNPTAWVIGRTEVVTAETAGSVPCAS